MTKKLELNADQEAFVKGLSKEDRAEFDALEDADKLELLNLQVGIVGDAKELEGKVETETTGYKVDGTPILVLGGTGIRGIRAGMRIIAQFMGIDFIFSDEPKENWTPVKTLDGRSTKYRTSYAKFRRTDGSTFGIFLSPMMKNSLRTLLTNAASPRLVSNDPIVTIEYHGKLKKDVLKKDFNFELTTGSEAHAVIVKKEKGAMENLEAGVHCYLSSPIPAGNVDTDDMTSEERELLSFNNMREANRVAGQGNAQIEAGVNNAQIQ